MKDSTDSEYGEPRLLLRRGFPLLLLLTVMPAFFSIPNQNTPITTVIVTGTSTANWPTVVNSTTSVTTQISWTQLQFHTLTSRSFSIDPTMGRYQCIYDHLPFTATKGQRILGSFQSSSAVSFYLLSENAFNAWVSASQCTVQNDLARQENANQYLLDVILPADGMYELLFLNSASSNSASITAIVAGSSPLVASLTTTMVANVSIPTTLTATREIEFVGYPAAINWGFRLAVLIIPVVIVVVIAFLILTIRRRHARGKKAPSVLKQLQAAATSPAFCGKCGTELASGAEFCTNCGSAIKQQPS